ncbi:helix-turn-helix domain-containing protein [Actinacidiphila guanduensis]|uniref:HTH luxR-type domain-containing protein n=1 Tax=Actinacidiphila guanduensis TaxID=310781 RepID=A0A1H0L9N8_9ACTN|nr:hypothetical protein [Actinacidiphila guanduensis]SDO64766.1 hypothetical protein SAMN05216259_111127 [Actinacidiphila guanduensis]
MTERPFEAVGLSADADRAYPLLVASRGVAEEELAGQLRIPVDQAHAACEELAALGLVRLGAEGRWYPLPPHAGMLPLLARAQDRLRRGRELLDRLGVEYQRVHEGHRAEEIVQAVEGADAIRERLGLIHRQATEEVLVFAAGDEELEQTGVSTVRQRVVVERARFEEEGWHGAAAGAGVRVVERLPARMCIADRTVAVLPPAAGEDPKDPVMLVVGPSALLDALVQLFETVWAGGVPLARAAAGRGSIQERILAMLVLGTTDVAMARSLGVAVRTVQRRIVAMERAAGVDNRIQLVWHAARHGWLD